MRALTLTSFDGLDGVVLADVPEPQVGEDSVTVRVHAAALGPWDVATTEGMFASAGGLTTFPQTIGWDFAGTIAAAGTAVTQWKPGDRVLGFSPQPWTGIGAIAELIAVPPDLIAALPAELDFVTGATLPVTALTAHLAIENGQVQPGASLLVIGAAGAVGGVIVQLGAKLGAQIIASVAADDFQAVRELGGYRDRRPNRRPGCSGQGAHSRRSRTSRLTLRDPWFGGPLSMRPVTADVSSRPRLPGSPMPCEGSPPARSEFSRTHRR